MSKYLDRFIHTSSLLMNNDKEGCYVPKEDAAGIVEELWTVRNALGSDSVNHKTLLESYRVRMFSICDVMQWQLANLIEHKVEKDPDSNADIIPVPLNIFIACVGLAVGQRHLQTLRDM